MRDGFVDNLYFGGGGDTVLTPLALAIFITASILILFLPRKYAIVPLFGACLLITVRQQLVVAGLHFMTYRLLLLVAWVRVIRESFSAGRTPFPNPMNSFDKVFLAWALCNAITFTLLWHQFAAFVNRLGFLYTTLGAYFLLRYLIRDREDVIRTIKTLSFVSAGIAAAMVHEHFARRNLFSAFGGVPALSYLREGRVRAEGPFLHSIVAGVFGAMLMPLFVGLWQQGKGNRLAAALGVISSTAMTITSASSTPMMTYLAGCVGLCLWGARKHLRLLRWGLVFLLLALQAVMKVPVWFLLSKVSGEIGGSGYHRSMLVDQFLRRFGEWWLIGTQNTRYWGYDMWDCINAYIRAGVEGGLITFMLFIAVLVYGYKRIGVARSLTGNDRKNARLTWAIGVCLFANTVAFFGEIYYDQSVIGWYALLVMIAAAPFAVDTRKRGSGRENVAAWRKSEETPLLDQPVSANFRVALESSLGSDPCPPTRAESLRFPDEQFFQYKSSPTHPQS